MRTYSKCFRTLISEEGINSIRSVEFVYRTNVTCTIYLRSWHPDRTKGRISFQGKALKEKPSEAFGIAIEKFNEYRLKPPQIPQVRATRNWEGICVKKEEYDEYINWKPATDSV